MKLRHTKTTEEFESCYQDALSGYGPIDDVRVVDQHGEVRVFQRNVLEPVESWEEASRSSIGCTHGTVVSVFADAREVVVAMPDGFRLYWDGNRAVLQRRKL